MPSLANGLGLSRTRFSGGGFVGPLDDYTANLSVMLLPFRGLSGYTGDGFRVRDTTGGAEQNISFDPVTGDLAAFTVGGNAAIRWWYDQSGSVRNAGNATAIQQPLLTTNIVNSQPVCRLDGINDTLVANLPASAFRTIYLVARKRSAAIGNAARGISIGTAGYSVIDCDLDSGSGSWRFYSGEDGETSFSLGGNVESWSLVVLTLSASLVSPWVNNTAGTSFVPYGDFVDAGTMTLGFQSANLDIGAVLYYSTEHNNTTRQAIQTVLANKFGITLA